MLGKFVQSLSQLGDVLLTMEPPMPSEKLLGPLMGANGRHQPRLGIRLIYNHQAQGYP